jgi:hypothetical protein
MLYGTFGLLLLPLILILRQSSSDTDHSNKLLDGFIRYIVQKIRELREKKNILEDQYYVIGYYIVHVSIL